MPTDDSAQVSPQEKAELNRILGSLGLGDIDNMRPGAAEALVSTICADMLMDEKLPKAERQSLRVPYMKMLRAFGKLFVLNALADAASKRIPLGLAATRLIETAERECRDSSRQVENLLLHLADIRYKKGPQDR